SYNNRAYVANDGLPYLDEKDYFLTKHGEPHIGASDAPYVPGSKGAWEQIDDHTHPGDLTRGYFMEINSDEKIGKYYHCQIEDLCPSSELLFTAWIANVLQIELPHAVNQVFKVVDPNAEANAPALVKYYTGTIPNSLTDHSWKQYGFFFPLPAGVESVGLTITNNADGSSGNDLGIDDIQINYCGNVNFVPDNYPSDGYVCGNAPITGIITHSGGLNLPNGYQWFYSTTGDMTSSSEWVAISEILALEETAWTSVDENTNTYPIALYPKGNEIITPSSDDFPNFPFGYYRIRIGTDPEEGLISPCNYFGNPFPYLDKEGDTMYWIPGNNTGNTTSTNWNDPDNWYKEDGVTPWDLIPTECVDVHIPGNATSYPILLSGEGIENACRDIYFHFGGEVAQPQNLSYRHAYVMYNFGVFDSDNEEYNGKSHNTDRYSAEAMNRDQWYCLAAPLKSMYSGDFSVGGFPLIWQRAFKSSPNYDEEFYDGGWAYENNAAGWKMENQQHAISVMVASDKVPTDNPGYAEDGFTNQSYIDNIRFAGTEGGVLYMPYFFENNPEHRQRLYAYDGTENTFYYFFYNLAGLPKDPSQPDVIERGEEAYRFVFENELSKAPENGYILPLDNIDSDIIMVGNPFISSLDFSIFSRDNNNVDGYLLFSETEDSPQFTTWSLTAGSEEEQGSLIAPLQAFFITKGARTSLTFNYEQSVIRSGDMQLKSSTNSMKDDVIYLKATDSKGRYTSGLTLSWQDVDVENMSLVRPEQATAPSIYAIDAQGNYNIIQFEGGYTERTVPIDIAYSGKDPVEISVRNTDRLQVKELYLVDKYLNKEIDLLENNNYSFIPVEGIINRFEIV
ncbi:hypothetical protein LJB84_03405, partial [Bacteroidales bacterium OttesenSCG-928-J19]|nr:hypothetical protein [Bacteroidales bacterium OttesenSCG-928-J19]